MSRRRFISLWHPLSISFFLGVDRIGVHRHGHRPFFRVQTVSARELTGGDTSIGGIGVRDERCGYLKQPSHIHGGDLLPFRDLSHFLSQLVGRSLIIKLPTRVDLKKGTNP